MVRRERRSRDRLVTKMAPPRKCEWESESNIPPVVARPFSSRLHHAALRRWLERKGELEEPRSPDPTAKCCSIIGAIEQGRVHGVILLNVHSTLYSFSLL